MFENIRADADSLRAALPQAPTSNIGQAIHRSVQMLRYRDRFRYLPAAGILILLGVVGLLAGMLARSTVLTAAGCASLVGGFVMAVRLDPSQLEAQVALSDRDTQRLKTEHGIHCQQAAEEYATGVIRSLEADARVAVKSGASLSDINGQLQELEKGWRDTESILTSELAEKRTTLQLRRDEFNKARVALSSAARNWRGQFVPGRSRQAARTTLAALQRLTDAECEETMTLTCVKACRRLAEAVVNLGRNHGTGSVVAVEEDTGRNKYNDVPWYLGTPLPPVEMLEGMAIKHVGIRMPGIRESVLGALTGGEKTEAAVAQAVDQVISAVKLWPTTIQEYLAHLNGDSDSFVDRVFKEAAELCPSRPIPGRKRHRKLFAFTGGSSTSPAVKALKERAPDSVGVFGNEYLPSELLVVAEERNVVLAELPEAMSCIEAFRALPRERQELLVTAVEHDEDVINYHPDMPHDNGHPGRLLASARTLGVVSRSGNEEYGFGGRTFAKGYRGAEGALRIDQRLAAQVEAKVEEVVTREGFASVITRLDQARQNPGTVAPKDVSGDFVTAVAEAIAELEHRAEVAAVVK